MRRLFTIKLLLLIAVVATFVILLATLDEPRCQGRTLTSWLKQCWDTPLDETNRLTEAQNAVRAIGAAKALPVLMKLAEAHDGPFRSWLIQQNERWNLRFLKLQEDSEKQMLAVAGFEILGTNCAPAVPQLRVLLEDANHAFTAVRCLAEVGKAAELALCQSLTNKNPMVRRWSIGALAAVTDDVEVYVVRLKRSLKDSDGDVQREALRAIADQTHAPDVAIPILESALSEDSDLAASLLAHFGTNALVTFGALSNAVDHASSKTAHQALNTLVTIAPQEALPLVLRRLRSPEPRDRSRAVAILCNYAVTNSEILPAIKLAASDPSPGVSRRAKLFITDLYLAGRSDEFFFPDEPIHDGKRLGEWLKQRKDGYMFSQAAENALRSMGTNVAPALLRRLTYTKPPYDLPDYDVNMEAVAAFMILGEQAKAVLPTLEHLMDSEDRDTALRALLATVGMGSEAVPCLIKGLTNQFSDVRNEAAHYLTDGPVAQFTEQRKVAVPILLKLLSDTNEFVRMNTTNALKEIDPKTAASVGIK